MRPGVIVLLDGVRIVACNPGLIRTEQPFWSEFVREMGIKLEF